MNRSVALAIDIETNAAKAVDGFDDVGSAADRMATNVDDATRKADAASSRLDSVAESSDKMASSSSQAAGGLGDLGGALSAVPGPLGAVGSGMEALAPAIMGVTGASDLLNLATESSIVLKAKDAIASGRQRVATIATAGATKAAAVAQRILNAAMKANPIGLAVAALALLVAGFILAYKKSETFRNIVNGVMDKVRDAIGWVVDKVQAVIDKVKGPLGAVFTGYRKIVETEISIVKGVIQGVIDVVQKVIDKIEWAIQKAKDLANKVNPFDGPAPDTSGHFVSPSHGGSVPPSRSSSRGGDTYNITVNGAVGDHAALGRVLTQVLVEHSLRTGQTIAIG